MTTHEEDISLLYPGERSSRGRLVSTKKGGNVKRIERDGSELKGGGFTFYTGGGGDTPQKKKKREELLIPFDC